MSNTKESERAELHKTIWRIANDLRGSVCAVIRGRIEYVGFIRGRRDPIYCALRGELHRLAPALIREPEQPDSCRVLPISSSGDRWSRLYENRRRSVGLLEVVRPNGERAAGTGFAAAQNELLTAAHNLQPHTHLIRPNHDPLAIAEGLFHAAGRTHVDAAIVSIDHGLPPLQIDRRLPLVGEHIAIIGFATVPQRQPTLGIYPGTVESLSESYSGALMFIQVSTQASGGLSGSPMFDAQGRVLGVVIEAAFEQTTEGVRGREFFTVLPIRYALEIRERSIRQLISA